MPESGDAISPAGMRALVHQGSSSLAPDVRISHNLGSSPSWKPFTRLISITPRILLPAVPIGFVFRRPDKCVTGAAQLLEKSGRRLPPKRGRQVKAFPRPSLI